MSKARSYHARFPDPPCSIAARLTREMGHTTGAVLTLLIVIALVILFVRLLGDVARGELANRRRSFAFSWLLAAVLFTGIDDDCAVCRRIAALVAHVRDSEMSIWSTPASP